MTTPQHLALTADDGWPVGATLFAGRGDGAAVLVSGAAAVPQRFYAPFALHLVGAGASAVLTYDYRGIARSVGERSRRRSLRMKDWALHDFPAALAHLRRARPDVPLVGLGHSFGGQAIGLQSRPNVFERYATLNTMSGYWRGLQDGRSVWWRTQIVGKGLSRILGEVPGWAGLREAMPGGVFLDWARWIATPDYFFSDPDLPETANYAKVALPYLNVSATDDPWANPDANLDFMRHYANADVREIWLRPGPGERIGHTGFFRRRNAGHWPPVADFLLRGRWGEARPLGSRARIA